MNKGFANILLIIGVAVVTLAGSIFYTNHEKDNINSSLNKLGATIATTSLSDTIGTFRTNVNTSLENINTQVGSISSTISAFGNIVSQNTPLAVSVGGTGTTTVPSGYQFLSSSGTFPTWKTLASSTGITITHTATSTIIGTAGFDSGANIAFTGNNTFAGSSTFNGRVNLASSTFITATTTLSANLVGAAYIPKLASAVVTSTTSFSTTSGTFTVIGTSTANGMASTTITLLGTHRVMLTYTGHWNPGANMAHLTYTVDGVDVASGNKGVYSEQDSGGGETTAISSVFITEPLAAGSHTFRALVFTDGGTLVVLGNGVTFTSQFSVTELYN